MNGIGLDHIQPTAFVAHGTAAAGPGIAAVLVVAASLVVPLAGVLLLALRPPRRGDRDDGHGDSGGGGGPGGPPRPSPGPPRPESGPVWWPEFERQFAAYVEYERRRLPVLPDPPAAESVLRVKKGQRDACPTMPAVLQLTRPA